MSVVLATSIVIRMVAVAAAMALLWRLRDWRMVVLTGLLALMTVSAVAGVATAPMDGALAFAMHHDELAELLASVFAALALLFLGRTLLDQRRSLIAQRINEQRLSRAQRMARLGNWELDLDSSFLRWSDETYRIFGISPELEGRVSRERFYELVHPEDRELVRETFLATVSGRSSYSIDHRILLADGEIRVVHQEAEVVSDASGRAIRMVGTCQDVTDRKRAENALRAGEARLKAIIDNSPAVIGLKDVDGHYLLVNRAYETIHGNSNDEIRGKTAYDIFDRDTADAFTAAEREALKTGRPVEAEIKVPTVSGERIFMVVRFPVPQGPGTNDLPIATGLIATDITERKRVETELVAAKERAEIASRAKSDFLANMSHELRTPLNAIIGFSDIIRNETFGPAGNPKYVEYAHDIYESGAHLLGLISEILDLAKVEAGKMELYLNEFSIDGAVHSCLSLVRERAAARGLVLKSEVPGDLPPLRADERKIKQVLLNLLSNAIKFTPRGGVVTVSASAGKAEFAISVTDSGIGMTRDEIEIAMLPFGQVTGHLDRAQEGTGLGLPLSMALVKLHGGRLELVSVPGSGTTARVILPATGAVDGISAA